MTNAVCMTNSTRTSDEMYVWDDLDEQMYQTDKILNKPAVADAECAKAYERYLVYRERAYSPRGIDYERTAKYGCRIGGGCGGTHDAIMDMIELQTEYDDKKKEYEDAKRELYALLKSCDTLTSLERKFLEERHMSRHGKGYTYLANRYKLRNYHAALYIYKKAYTTFSEWLRKNGYINTRMEDE